MTRRAVAEHWPVNGAVEGVTDAAVWRRLLTDAGFLAGELAVAGGKAQIKNRIRGYNKAAQFDPWLVLVDLDRESCAPRLVAEFLPSGVATLMRLRVAVRELEAWLLADHERLALSLGIDASLVPTTPENLDDPEQQLVNLAARSTDRACRRALVPEQDSGRQVGPGYSAWVEEFVSDRKRGWRPDTAAARAPSLARCLTALTTLKDALAASASAPN